MGSISLPPDRAIPHFEVTVSHPAALSTPARVGSIAYIVRRVPLYTDAELEAAVEALSDPERFRAAEATVAAAAPRLQGILGQALQEGGWFSEDHESELSRALAIEADDERARAVRTLLAEEARIGMMVGVVVGWALREELGGDPDAA